MTEGLPHISLPEMPSEHQAQQMQSMKPRLIKGMQADYIPATYDDAIGNTSGRTVYGPNVLVKMDECSSASAGGVLLPADMIERMNEAAVTGCIYQIGPDAFRGLGDRPSLGQRVYIEKYAGIKVTGDDGLMYRVVDEKCVACGVTETSCVAEI